MPVGERAEEGEELRAGGADPTRALDRLDDDRGEIRLASAEGRLDPVGIAPRQLHDEPRHRLGDAGRAGHHEIVGPVVRTLELRDERPPGERPGRPDREHRRLGPGAREAHPLDRGHAPDQLLGELDLGLGRGRERRSAADLGLDGRDDRRVGMAEDERGVVAEEVAVFVAVHVADDEPCPAAMYGGYGAV